MLQYIPELATLVLLAKRNSPNGSTGTCRKFLRQAAEFGAQWVDIAASHKSAPFFSRFGARVLAHVPDGWGPGMHRVDMELPVTAESLWAHLRYRRVIYAA